MWQQYLTFKNTDVPTIALHDENGADVIKLERFQDKYMLFIESDSYEIQPLLLEHSVFNKLTILYDDIENTYTIHVNGVLHDSINPTLRLQSVIISKIYIDTVQSQIITDVDISPILLSDEELNIRMNTLKLKFSGIHDISEDDVSLIKQIDVGSNIDDVNGYVVFNGGITIDNNDNGIVITPTYLSFDREATVKHALRAWFPDIRTQRQRKTLHAEQSPSERSKIEEDGMGVAATSR